MSASEYDWPTFANIGTLAPHCRRWWWLSIGQFRAGRRQACLWWHPRLAGWWFGTKPPLDMPDFVWWPPSPMMTSNPCCLLPEHCRHPSLMMEAQALILLPLSLPCPFPSTLVIFACCCHHHLLPHHLLIVVLCLCRPPTKNLHCWCRRQCNHWPACCCGGWEDKDRRRVGVGIMH